MKRIVSILILVLSLFLVGCEKKDNGGTTENPPVVKPDFPTVEKALNANQSDETIFVKLNKDGGIETIKGVVHLTNVKKNTFVSYKGNYANKGHANLSNILELNVTENLVKAPVLDDMDDYFFEVSLDKEKYTLPFNFQFTYKLNGEEKTYADIVGKSGNVTIEVKVNAAYESGYLAQIQIPIDIEKNKVVSKVGASASVLVGKTTTLAYMAMPNSNNTFVIELESSKFSLGLIQITLQEFDLLEMLPFDVSVFNGVPFEPSMLNDLSLVMAMLGNISFDTAMLGDISQLPQGITQTKGGVNLVKTNLDGLINELHPGLIGAFNSLNTENQISLDALTPEIVGKLLAPGALINPITETNQAKLALLPHIVAIQTQLGVVNNEVSELNAYIATHKDKLATYIGIINNYDAAYTKLNDMLTTITEIETIINALVPQMNNIEGIIEGKDAFVQTLNLLALKLEAMKTANLELIREFQLYEHHMSRYVGYVIELLEHNISLGTELATLNQQFTDYSAALKVALPHFTAPEEITVVQTAIAILDGIPNDPQNLGLINTFNYILQENFVIAELTARKGALEAVLVESPMGLPLAGPLGAFVTLNESLTLKQEGQSYSFYQGLEQLAGMKEYFESVSEETLTAMFVLLPQIKEYLNSVPEEAISALFVMLPQIKDYFDLISQEHELKSFFDATNPKPRSVQFVIVC